MKTYLPTLKLLLRAVCNFISKHRDRILAVIGNDNADKLDGVITACNVLMPVLDAFIPDPV